MLYRHTSRFITQVVVSNSGEIWVFNLQPVIYIELLSIDFPVDPGAMVEICTK